MLRKLPDEWTIMEYIEAYHIMTDMPYKDILNKYITEIFIMCNFVLKSLDYIAEKEEVLQGKPDAKQVQAGIEDLYKFGDLTMLKEIADYMGEYPRSGKGKLGNGVLDNLLQQHLWEVQQEIHGDNHETEITWI